MPEATETLAADILERMRQAGAMLVTAESCTGGLIAGALTDISGASDVVWGGFVTYANAAKSALIGVDPALLAPGGPGAVSAEVARAMAQGTLATARAAEPTVRIAIAVTGVAGPTGGTPDKPVGLVHFALATPDATTHMERRFGALTRAAIRTAAVHEALSMLLAAATNDA